MTTATLNTPETIEGDEKEEVLLQSFFENEENLIDRIKKHLKKYDLTVVNFKALTSVQVFDPDKDFPPQSKTPVLGQKICLDGPVGKKIVLFYNDINRTLTIHKALKHAIDVLTGRHKLMADGLVFDWNKQVNQGQHRAAGTYLASLVCPEVKAEFYAAFNNDPALMPLYDSHKPRTQADRLIIGAKQRGDFEKYKNVTAKDLVSLVNGMPSMKGKIEEDKNAFIDKHTEALKEALALLQSVRMIGYNIAWASVFADAMVGYDGKGFVNPSGARVGVQLAERFVTNKWIQYTEAGKVDPLNLLCQRLVANKSANKRNRLNPSAILSATMYSLRKALQEIPVAEKQGTRTFARFEKFKPEEFIDYKENGAASKELNKRSVAKKVKKLVIEEDTEEDED